MAHAAKAAGARRSLSQSKLARGLGRRHPGATRSGVQTLVPAQGPSSSATAAEVVIAYLGAEVSELTGHDVAVRLDLPDSIHQMRVATRRLRSAVRTFDRLFADGAVQPVARELAWLADELGAARDAEVLRARLASQVSAEREQHRTTAAGARAVDREMGRTQRETFAHVVSALDSERYRLLVASLDALVATPPFTERAARPARAELLRPVRKAARNVDGALTAADEHPHGAERAAALHEARKKAKRARYAAEAVAPAFGRHAEAFATGMESLQDLLGEHHDSVVLQHRLEDLAREAESARAFTLGRLHAAQSTVQAELEASIRSAAAAAAKKSLRAWLA